MAMVFPETVASPSERDRSGDEQADMAASMEIPKERYSAPRFIVRNCVLDCVRFDEPQLISLFI
jgi:hypothetical protein